MVMFQSNQVLVLLIFSHYLINFTFYIDHIVFFIIIIIILPYERFPLISFLVVHVDILQFLTCEIQFPSAAPFVHFHGFRVPLLLSRYKCVRISVSFRLL